jgi:hypothetical protein
MECIAFHIITALLLVCYLKSILEDPGEIPDNDPTWLSDKNASSNDDRAFEHLNMQESKKGGGRRWCKWCGKYKPDRCHHCRVCRSCILKMDHHCPWIYNCVGFKNYKYFYLLLFYCVLDLHLIMWSMVESVVRAWDLDTPFVTIFFVLFGESLSIFLGVLLTVFFGFHNWLMIRAKTTIEFCEQKMPKEKNAQDDAKSGDSVYDLGCFANMQAVLGQNPFTWPVPMSPYEPHENGLSFVRPQSRLSKDFDGHKGRMKGHQKMQRTSNR